MNGMTTSWGTKEARSIKPFDQSRYEAKSTSSAALLSSIPPVFWVDRNPNNKKMKKSKKKKRKNFQ